MKKILFMLVSFFALFCLSCTDRHDNVKQFAEEETIYPGMYDTIGGKIGFERVEIDLLKAGRIPESQIKLGKAKKTLIEYDNEEVLINSLCSWVNITGLTQSKLYRFKVFTIDEFGDKSVPQEIALIPFTDSDKELLTIAYPTVITSPWAATLTWPNSLSSVLLDYYSLSYSYKDRNNTPISGERSENPQFSIENLEAGKTATVNITYKVVPKVDDVPILDTVFIEQTVTLNMPTSETYQRDLQNRAIQSMLLSGDNMKIRWATVTDFTMQYTVLQYTGESGEQSIRIENTETETFVPGLGSGMSFSVTSNYKPEGVTGVYIDATPKVYTAANVDLDRTGWTSTQSHSRPSDSPSPLAHLDGDISTFLSLVKPGKSTGGASTPIGDIVYFINDMGSKQTFDYFRIRHRNDGIGLRVWGLSVYGSDDGVNFSEIRRDIDIPSYSVPSILETPNIELPLSSYRYIKVVYEKWDPVNNSAMQISEFYLGKK
ncbi:MAG: discoidin domain-containing protein [Prevotellaceae bacterium]|jgi:hypothetical protein|nr:discoidin domain-containing protein [Prevotellaceae bacterium]